jgi:hypothetical protein
MSFNLDIRSKLPLDAVIFINQAYDNSIIGTTFDGRVIYDFDKMVEELMTDEGWTEEEAIDWIEFNTLRALPYGGEKAPLVMRNEG